MSNFGAGKNDNSIMKIVNLGESNSVLNRFVAELRDVDNVQKDSMRFRRNIERIGEIMAYEISKDLFTCRQKRYSISSRV